MITVPPQFAGNKHLERAYRHGYDHAHGVACHNVPRIGQKYWTDSEGCLVATSEDIRYVHHILTLEALRHSRCYSPFESIAKELNDLGEGGWFVMPYGDEPIGPFDTEDEAKEEAESLGLENYDIEELPSSDEAWEAFEAGELDAIRDDLASYDNSDYGIEDDDESEDEDSEDEDSSED